MEHFSPVDRSLNSGLLENSYQRWDKMPSHCELPVPIALLMFALLLSACVGDGDTPVTSDNSADPTATSSLNGGEMAIEGEIVEVMESWPLQLTVVTQSGRQHVGLLSETRVVKEGQLVDPSVLTSGVRVRIEGENTGPNAMSARNIEILEGR
jgi:hypothetical protein